MAIGWNPQGSRSRVWPKNTWRQTILQDLGQCNFTWEDSKTTATNRLITMFEEPFKLTKRFRYQEEYGRMQHRTSWTKVILNLEKGTILLRTPHHWLLLIIFYTIFFSGIICLWFLCYWVFEKTLVNEQPKWLLTQPGFSFEPATTFRENYLKIEFNEQSLEEVDDIVEHINKALQKYGKIPQHYFGECENHHDYGYRQRKPCFFLKINRIIGFKTQPIESINDLPHDTPQEMYEYLQNLSKQELKQRIWISCESRPALKFLYYPQRFYEISNVDYDASKSYINSNDAKAFYNESDFKRIIAVQIENISVNIKHHVRCFLWAKNIVRDLKGRMGRGLVRFSFEIKS
ncbi:sodium/potassium-transporting ATPase subunit beta-1-like [Calliphora vicina]|uniref:sodium/potassium-transporting ATPase subunit beta-1-like n=1 Tax=Calliphora vicina TaxID=7373 RepID=UPI00325AFB60